MRHLPPVFDELVLIRRDSLFGKIRLTSLHALLIALALSVVTTPFEEAYKRSDIERLAADLFSKMVFDPLDDVVRALRMTAESSGFAEPEAQLSSNRRRLIVTLSGPVDRDRPRQISDIVEEALERTRPKRNPRARVPRKRRRPVGP